MNLLARIGTIAVLTLAANVGVSQGSIVKVDHVLTIDLPGPFDGLRFLDMSYSDGLSYADALANAVLDFPNARLATPDEFDALFAAAGVTYSNPLVTASSAFETGASNIIASFQTATTNLVDLLLATNTFSSNPSVQVRETVIWTTYGGIAGHDPSYGGNFGGNTATSSQRDTLTINALNTGPAGSAQHANQPPKNYAGWLFVSEPAGAVVPEATSVLAWLGLGMVGLLVAPRGRIASA